MAWFTFIVVFEIVVGAVEVSVYSWLGLLLLLFLSLLLVLWRSVITHGIVYFYCCFLDCCWCCESQCLLMAWFTFIVVFEFVVGAVEVNVYSLLGLLLLLF